MSKILELYKSSIKITPSNMRYFRLLNVKKDILGCDSETTGLEFNSLSYLHTDKKDIEYHNPFPFGVSLSFIYNNKMVLVWARHTDTKLYNKCLKLIASDVTKTWHNSRYDLRVLAENNIKVGGFNHDSLTMSRIHWDRRKSHSQQSLTEFLCPELSGYEVELKKELTRIKTRYSRMGYPKDYANYSFIPHKMVQEYGLVDAFMYLIIYLRLRPEMERNYEHYLRELKVADVVTKIEQHGMRFNSKKARQAARYPRTRMQQCMENLKLLGGDALTLYPPKLAKAMLTLGVTEKQLTDKGKVTTGADVLRSALNGTMPPKAREFIESLLTFRGYQKTVNTYLLPLAKRAEANSGIVYTEINPSDTRTGRPACLVGKTEICTQRGPVPIKKIEVGDLVTTSTGRSERVLRKWHNGVHPVYKITLDSGHEIIATKTHRFLRSDKNWITIKEILDECINKVDKNRREYRQNHRTISKESLLHNATGSRKTWDYISQCILHLKQAFIRERNRCSKMDSQIKVKDGNKQSKLWKMWRTTSQLQRCLRRWLWIFNNIIQRKETFSPPCDYNETTWSEKNTKRMVGASHRWQSEKQRYKQSCSMYNERTSNFTLLAAEGLSFTAVKKINFVGCCSVYDLTIENNPSYLLSCGVFSHNSKNPNLLNIPNPESRKTNKKNAVRECFICRLGCAVYYFDISQQEYAVFGLYADERILNAYMDGEDIHQYMADQIGMPDQRGKVKSINFGVTYGMGMKTMKTLYGLTEDDYRLYHREFPSIREFQSICEYDLKQNGFVEDYFGRKYHIPVGQAYKAVNALVQGTCATAFKIGLLAVDETLDSKEHIILPVYDEIQIERPVKHDGRHEAEFAGDVIDLMSHIEQIEDRGLVFRVDVQRTTTNWAEKKSLGI